MTTYASAEWCVEDVHAYRDKEVLEPQWSDEQAENFLRLYEQDIAERMVERGWDALGECMDFHLESNQELVTW